MKWKGSRIRPVEKSALGALTGAPDWQPRRLQPTRWHRFAGRLWWVRLLQRCSLGPFAVALQAQRNPRPRHHRRPPKSVMQLLQPPQPGFCGRTVFSSSISLNQANCPTPLKTFASVKSSQRGETVVMAWGSRTDGGRFVEQPGPPFSTSDKQAAQTMRSP